MTIVCGAPNVVAGMKVPAALVGAKLPNDFVIARSKIRQITSHGMLCSAVELGLSSQAGEGLLALPKDAPVGKHIWDYLNLSDFVIDIAVTPNRGDCLSVVGLAIEVSALTECPLQWPTVPTVPAASLDTLEIQVENKAACPRYVGRIIRQVNMQAVTPIWMQERLRRSGTRCINIIVDIVNYVMLEWGQPMHAFDLAKIRGPIQVRQAMAHESLELLDGQAVTLNPDILIIADQTGPLAIAGAMGGLSSCVTSDTQDIFLESAYFSPASVAKSCQHYHLNSESAYRFQRGTDALLPEKAIERAAQFIMELAGGKVGPVIEKVSPAHLPQAKKIQLREARIKQILGMSLTAQEVSHILNRLGFVCVPVPSGFEVQVPARRSDIHLEIDLIEEIIRLHGYDKLPQSQLKQTLQIEERSEKILYLSMLRSRLLALGYNEAITYSFVDKKLQAALAPMDVPKALLNPISSEMAVMRTNLWPGLLNTYLYNQNRQQSRIRLFETGLRFLSSPATLVQQNVLSGLVSGPVLPEQWGVPSRLADFFDVKGDVEALIQLTNATDFIFKPSTHPALHPGQAADIYRAEKHVGVIGALHPSVLQLLSINVPVYVFEIELAALMSVIVPKFKEMSKFPEIRRDIAIFVDQTVPAEAIQDTIMQEGGELLREVTVFDVYVGKGVLPHQKSIALSLTLQDDTRTLVDEEVAKILERIIVALKERFAAELRG